MSSVTNKVQLTGHLGQEPMVKQFEGGADGSRNKMASFSIATDEGYMNANGKKIENTQWHRVVAWGELALAVETQLHKGVKVSIEGKISNRSYQAKDGTTKYTTEIIASGFEVISKGDK